MYDILTNWKDHELKISIEECGGNGDCLFHAVARGFSKGLRKTITMKQVRNMLADTLNTSNIAYFIKDHGLNVPANNIEIVKQYVSTCGNVYQGTDTSLLYLSKVTHIGFMVFSSHGPAYTTFIGKSSPTVLFLFNVPDRHWTLCNIQGVSMTTNRKAAKIYNLVKTL